MLEGGLYSGRRIIACIERLVYNWGPYKGREGGGGSGGLYSAVTVCEFF